MKGRDERKQTIIVAAAAIVGSAIAGAIVGITAVTPFIYTKASDVAANAMKNHTNGIPAAKAKKAELAKLNKEKAALEKDKKALEKKKKNARKAQAKKIYLERAAVGYEESIPVFNKEVEKALAEADKLEGKKSKKKKTKVKKEKKTAPIVMEKQEKLVMAKPQVSVDGEEPDYSESAQMFKGISF